MPSLTPTTSTPLQPSKGLSTPSKAATNSVSTPSSNPPLAKPDSVKLSGEALMLSRLYGQQAPKNLQQNGNPFDFSNVNSNHYLTADDRTLLAKMYDFASTQNADLSYVDDWARSLGEYRRWNNPADTGFNSGHNYDVEGHQLTISYNPQDTTTTQNLLNSEAMGSTQLDQAFLRHILDPGFGALTFPGNFQFLEKMVTKFSDSPAANNVTLGPEFARYIRPPAEEQYVLTPSKEVMLPEFNPQMIVDNGRVIVIDHDMFNPDGSEKQPNQSSSVWQKRLLATFTEDKGPLREVYSLPNYLSLLGFENDY